MSRARSKREPLARRAQPRTAHADRAGKAATTHATASRPTALRVVASVIAAAALLALGAWIDATWLTTGGALAQCGERYQLVNSSVACNGPPTLDKRVYDPLREELIATLRTRIESGAIGAYAIYFRDLVNGPAFGIDEYAKFVPASLLKLPLVLAFLAEEEDRPGLLQQAVAYDGDEAVPIVQTVRSGVSLERGRAYTVETLLENVLRYSDNASYLALRRYQRSTPDGDARLLQTYRELGIVNPNDPLDQTVTVRGYASLFRLLYNVSYLDAELSERALRWLAESSFKDGLVAGVPPGTVVAHKFGERALDGADASVGTRQFHDCGIVYYPKNPYLLCVMTRGEDFAPLIETVRTVSSRVYAEVAARDRTRVR